MNDNQGVAAILKRRWFYAEYWEDGEMKFHEFDSIREAAQWIIDNADWTTDVGESGLSVRKHSGLFTESRHPSTGETCLMRVGMASNYCRRALNIAVETDDWQQVIRRSKSEQLTYDTGVVSS